MNDIFLKFKTSSFTQKISMLVLGFVGLFVAFFVITTVFSLVFLKGAGFSEIGSRIATDRGTTYSNSVSGTAPAYDGNYGEMYASKRGSISPSPMPPIMPEVPASTGTLPSDKKVIRNGSLALLVEKAEDSATKIQDIAIRHSGFVDNSNIYEVSDGVKTGNIIIRVPEDKFDLALGEIKKLALKVTSENVSSSDVTAQFVDLEASLSNMKVEEEQYRQIMARATKIQDILDVSSRLAEVRGRIERAQGQLNYLARQVAMSTISISLTAQAEVEVFGIVWRPLTVLKQASKNLLSDLTNFVDYLIYFLFRLPVLILQLALFVAILWAFWRIGKWAKVRFFPTRW